MFGMRSFIKYFSLQRILTTILQHNEMLNYKNKTFEDVIMPYHMLLMVIYTLEDFSVFGSLLYFGIKLSADHPFDAIQQHVLLYVTCLLLAALVPCMTLAYHEV